jgi:hypothetical protein
MFREDSGLTALYGCSLELRPEGGSRNRILEIYWDKPLLHAKLREADELVGKPIVDELHGEAADLIYFIFYSKL